ncbi:MAG: methylglyoxal synthase [Bacteroidales bacterium]
MERYKRKRIALVAHDNKKKDLVEWVSFNREVLLKHNLVCTGTTGKLVEEALIHDQIIDSSEINIRLLKSGPLGGDQQLGSLISDGKIDILIFFWDPMQAQPHDVDVKALLRICVLYNVPTAMNRSSADFIISSSLFEVDYKPTVKDYSDYIGRNVP